MFESATAHTWRLLRQWAAPGRGVACRVALPDVEFGAGVAERTGFPAASLLKVPLAFAAEEAMRSGALDPDGEVAVADVCRSDAGVVAVLRPDRHLTVAEVLALALAVSDNDCAAWLADAVGIAAVRDTLAAVGCPDTTVLPASRAGIGPFRGATTPADALTLIEAALSDRYPRTAHALGRSVFSSRIPLGAREADVQIAHKTGSLTGVAHDVAVLTGDRGQVRIAFLSEQQHDTLVTGYEMGICTRGILQAWGLGVQTTVGLA